jgi:non-ribosomal peptide synthetase component F
VRRTPDAVAVVDTGGAHAGVPATSLTYTQMGAAANAVSRSLLKVLGDKKKDDEEVVVAIVMHKGWEQVVSALGVLGCHATYLPIDAKWPAKRAGQILAASGSAAVVTTRALMQDEARLSAVPAGVPVVLFEDAMEKEKDSGENDAAVEVSGSAPRLHSARSMAYLIYTSGSTGEPKGVCVLPSPGCDEHQPGLD